MLTDDEHKAIRLAGELSTFITNNILGDGPTRQQDQGELEALIHGVQGMIARQAIARIYPDRYRLLGEIIAT